jgi:hypothetical protein
MFLYRGIDDSQGWRTPEPAGVCDMCTLEKNRLAGEHTSQVLDPFVCRMRALGVGAVVYSLRGAPHPITERMYRTLHRGKPRPDERAAATEELAAAHAAFEYEGHADVPDTLTLTGRTPVADYFAQFPGLDSTDCYNGAGYWDQPVPVVSHLSCEDDDVVMWDDQHYSALRAFLQGSRVRHVLLAGYAADMCLISTTAGYENVSQDFNTFIVGDATVRLLYFLRFIFPANTDEHVPCFPAAGDLSREQYACLCHQCGHLVRGAAAAHHAVLLGAACQRCGGGGGGTWRWCAFVKSAIQRLLLYRDLGLGFFGVLRGSGRSPNTIASCLMPEQASNQQGAADQRPLRGVLETSGVHARIWGEHGFEKNQQRDLCTCECPNTSAPNLLGAQGNNHYVITRNTSDHRRILRSITGNHRGTTGEGRALLHTRGAITVAT